jgi:hypothetical protein
MSQGARTRLTLVGCSPFLEHVSKEILILRAKKLFPKNETLAMKWVDAKLRLGTRKPSVEIGLHRIDTSSAVRALPPNSLTETLEIPHFLRRFLK